MVQDSFIERLRLVIPPYELFITACWQKSRLIYLHPAITPIISQKYTDDSPLAPSLLGLLNGTLSPFELQIPYTATGSPFSVEVWTALLTSPYGRTMSYKKLAQMLHTSPRAIGQALNANPLPIIIPCHRVIGSRGEITGFSCGIEVKEILLTIEDLQRRAHEDSHYVRQPRSYS